MKRGIGIIWLLKAGVRTGLIAAAMAVTVSMIAFAQTTESAIERAPATAKAAVANSSPTSDENSTSVQTGQPAKPAVPAVVEVEIQRRFNELRHELLDERIKLVDWWLDATAIFLTLLGIVAVIAGYVSFKRFHEIVAEARQHVTSSKQHAEEAQSLVEEIKAKRHEAESLVEKLNAETVGKDLDEAGRAAESVQGNPAASLIDQAIAAAVLLQRQGEIEKAIEKWRAVAHVSEKNDNNLAASAWFSVGYLLQDLEDSILAYDKAIRLKPDLAEAYNNRGNARAALGQYVEAIADFDEAIRLKPNDAEFYSNRGNAKHTLGRHDKVLTDYDEAIRLKPDFAEAYSNRGTAKRALGRYDEALTDYDEAIRLKPDFAEAYNNRGITKVASGRYDDAIADHDQAIRLKPKYAGAYSNRGNAKHALGRHDEALIDYDEAIRLKPDDAEVYSNRGNVKHALGRHDEALTDYDEAIRLKPTLAVVYTNRGNAKYSLGLKDEARNDFETALELARNTNNANIVDQAEQLLRDLDRDEGS